MAEHTPKFHAPSEAVKLVSHVVHARRTRTDFFAPEIFSDPAWDILLVLFLAKVRGEGMTTDQLAEAAGSSLSSSVRWIEILERTGLVHARCDRSGGGVKTVELAPRGWSAMVQWAQRWVESFPDKGGEPVTDLLSRMHDGKL
jgi:hypothetical protein